MIVTEKTVEEFVDIYSSRTYAQYVKDAMWYKSTHQVAHDFELQEDEQRSSLDGDYEFTGTNSLEEAVDLATNGWKDGIKKVKQKYDLSKKTKSSFIVEPKNNVYGSYVNIGRYLGGMPDCMVNNVVLTIPKKINIICKIGFLGCAEEEDYIEYGAKILQLIDDLESKNIRVSLEVRNSVINYGGAYYLDSIIVKNYEDFLNMNTLCFCLCHPSFHRRICFSNREKNDSAITKRYGFGGYGGYGSTTSLIVTEEEKKNSLCIDSGSSFEFDYDKFVIE